MKKSILMLGLLTISGFAQASTRCGVLDSYSKGPDCKPGQMCPHYVILQYELVQGERKTDLQTADDEVLKSFGELKGSGVCVQGKRDGKIFEVTAINLRAD